MRLLFWVVSAFFVVQTIFPLIRSSKAWIRVSDFPRLQFAVAMAVLLAGYVALVGVSDNWDILYLVIVIAAICYQFYRIFPYTTIAPNQVMDATAHVPDSRVRVMVANVLMENRDAQRLLDVVSDVRPDLLLLVEIDDWWHDAIKSLDASFPYRIKRPQDNYYGMEFFSKFELESDDVRYLLSDEIPSIRTGVRLPSGKWVDFFGVHPRPPDMDFDSEGRDAELLMVAKELRQSKRAAIVAGDLNDVAWSHTTRLFQRMSGALDPRRGRGMYNSFHAGYRFLRWPLDHVFHDNDFKLVELKRLPNIGSDHFPVLVELQYERQAEKEQEAPEADHEDHEEAEEKIENGREAVD